MISRARFTLLSMLMLTACNPGVAPGAAPRQLAPLSTSTVTSQRPTLRWELASGSDGARVELCRDRAMTAACTSFVALGSEGAPSAALVSGVWFWRATSALGGALGGAPSVVWQFTVGARTAPVDSSWGTTLDVNGDGFADLAVGATGATYVYLGSATGLPASPSVVLDSPDGGVAPGVVVASAGDVDGDGFGDLAVGAAGAYRVYVHLGSATGLAAMPSLSLAVPEAAGQYGWSVASAGDVDGDGFADLVVGAFAAMDDMGSAYVYLGSAIGLPASPSLTLAAPAGGQFGWSVASAGDVNGDGFADLAVGAYSANHAYVYLGSATGLPTSPSQSIMGPPLQFGASIASAGDVDGDGFADLAVGSSHPIAGRVFVYLGSATGLVDPPASTLLGPDGSGGFFGGSVASAGDVDGDGFADLAVGAASAMSGAGRVHVYLGSATGVPSSPSLTLTSPDGTGGGLGGSVASPGDIDGDGFADLAASAANRVDVFLGSATGLPATPSTSLIGPGAGFGSTVASAGASSRRAPSPLTAASRGCRAPRSARASSAGAS
jgi:hypothetical protein